jgi:putative endonuclease
MKNYWVYIMSNVMNTVLYVGVTNDLARRRWEHSTGKMEGFTRQYKCHHLVYYEEYRQITKAIEREKQLKGWSRAKKEALIDTMNPRREDFAVLFGWKK